MNTFNNTIKTDEIEMLLEENPNAIAEELDLALVSDRLVSWNKSTRYNYESENKRVESLQAYLKLGNQVAPFIIKKLADGTYTVIDGWHRLSAIASLGQSKIQAYVI